MSGDEGEAVIDVEAVSHLITSYLMLHSEAEREELAALHPEVFVSEVVVSLQDAIMEMQQTIQDVREVHSTIEGVADLLNLPSLSGLPPTAPRPTEDLLSVFSKELQRGMESWRCHAALGPIPAAGTTGSAWHQQPELVLEVLSYLPAEDILRHGEDVCAAWRYWLYSPAISRFFWIGVVQREFPEFLGLLLGLPSHTDALLQQDWRSLAMLCVSQVENAEEEVIPEK